jgi:hypothetical protein
LHDGAFPTEEAARADAMARATKDAGFVCIGYKSSNIFRLNGVRTKLIEWHCKSGFSCGFTGEAICDVSVRTQEASSACD